VIDPRGVRLERFRKNPVVLYAHDYEGLPVARSLWERVRDGDSGPELVAKPQFHMDTELSREVWALVEKGVLSAWSVGFIPEEWEPIDGNRINRRGRRERRERRTAAAGERPTCDAVREASPSSASSACSALNEVVGSPGFRVKKWDLLEYSAVPVAANFEALTRELEERRITAPALVKSLGAFGMREPDLVPQPIRPNRQDAKDAKGVKGVKTEASSTNHLPCREESPAVLGALGALAVEDVVSRGFDRWLARARGEGRA
jgi:hypothetical protein